MKKVSISILVMGLALMIACKSKPKDADIQTKLVEALKTSPGVTADVKEGVVTLSGQVADDAAKASAATLASTVEGVKSVTNNITVAPPPTTSQPASPVTVAADDALIAGVTTVMKDYPGIEASVKDGIVTVTGETSAAKWKILKMALDALHPKKVDATSLKVK